jgi:enoyl-CoA hydratase
MVQPDFFRVSQNGPIAQIVLNRPEKANSLDNSFWVELPQILRSMDHDPAVRVAVLSGEGKHFSSGMDLSAFDFIGELVKAEPGRAAFGFRKEILRLQDALNAIEEVRFPVIGIAHGACIGGAIDLLAACDICIASSDAKFAIEEVNVGMAADVGTLQRLPKMMSPSVVKQLAFTGRRFTPEEAKQWGFVTDVHPDKSSALEAGLELAKLISGKSPLAISGIKKAVNYARDHSVADGLDQVATWNGGMLRPEDINRSIRALKERTQAQYADLPRTDPASPPTLMPVDSTE